MHVGGGHGFWKWRQQRHLTCKRLVVSLQHSLFFPALLPLDVISLKEREGNDNPEMVLAGL